MYEPSTTGPSPRAVTPDPPEVTQISGSPWWSAFCHLVTSPVTAICRDLPSIGDIPGPLPCGRIVDRRARRRCSPTKLGATSCSATSCRHSTTVKHPGIAAAAELVVGPTWRAPSWPGDHARAVGAERHRPDRGAMLEASERRERRCRARSPPTAPGRRGARPPRSPGEVIGCQLRDFTARRAIAENCGLRGSPRSRPLDGETRCSLAVTGARSARAWGMMGAVEPAPRRSPIRIACHPTPPNPTLQRPRRAVLIGSKNRHFGKPGKP
jgi:hypothetical protein